MHINNLFRGLTEHQSTKLNPEFLYVCVFWTCASMSLSDWMFTCLLDVLSPVSWVCRAASCAALGLILGCWCVMCLGLWLCWRCDVYLWPWGIAVTAFSIGQSFWPKPSLPLNKSSQRAPALPCKCVYVFQQTIRCTHSVFKLYRVSTAGCHFLSLSEPGVFKSNCLGISSDLDWPISSITSLVSPGYHIYF